jgi:putative spermidine/putrescine transport system permease protein
VSRRLSGPLAWLVVPITAAALVFTLAPLVVTVATSFSDTAFVVFPPHGFTWRWYGQVLHDAEFQGALGFSTALALAATVGALLLGVPAAFAVVRGAFPGRDAVAAVLLAPLVFPVLITGVALLQLFSMLRSDNAALNLFIAHVLVTTPYVVRTVSASLMLADRTLEEAAQTLGAARWRIFRRITVPQIAPGLAAGALFAFMVSFDNFPISMWLADAQHNPVPLLIFQRISATFDPSVAAISTLLIGFAMAVVLVVERVAGLRRGLAM